MLTVLITGGAGYIGSHAVYSFLEAGYKVVVVDDLSTGVRENLAPEAQLYKGDIADRDLLDAVVRQHRIDGVLHFAGSVIVPESVGDPAKYYRNNAFRSLELVDFLISRGVKRFLFSSSAAVYGIPANGTLVSEASLLNPINPYGWSKLFVERMIRDISAASALNYGILRYFNVAGSDPNGRTGQSTPNATHLVKVACEVATGKRDSMRIYGTDYDTPDGTCVRDFIHVSDLSLAHVATYEFLCRSGRNACFNCGNGKGYSVLEVVGAVEQAHGRKLDVAAVARRPGDPSALVADASAIRKTLGWHAQYDLADIVETALAWERREQRDLIRVS
jgi:UDP-glucose 4-epimerase